MISNEILNLATSYGAELWVRETEIDNVYYLGFEKSADCYANYIDIYNIAADFDSDDNVSARPISVLKNMKHVRKVTEDEHKEA